MTPLDDNEVVPVRINFNMRTRAIFSVAIGGKRIVSGRVYDGSTLINLAFDFVKAFHVAVQIRT